MRPLSLTRNGGKTAVWQPQRAWEAGRALARLALLPLRGDCAAVPTSVSPAPCAACPPLLIPWLWLSSPRSTPAPPTRHWWGPSTGAEKWESGLCLQAPVQGPASLAFQFIAVCFSCWEIVGTQSRTRDLTPLFPFLDLK